MTTLYRARAINDGSAGTLFPTQGKANKAATALRHAGLSCVVEKLVLKKLHRKDLVCTVYNYVVPGGITEEDPFESIEVVRRLRGVKKSRSAKQALAEAQA